MKNFKKTYQSVIRALLCLSALMISSCDSFVELELPASQLTASATFEDKITANAAMVDVFSKMRDGGLFSGSSFSMPHLLGNYTDELTFYGNPQDDVVPFYTNTILASNTTIKSLWNSGYNQIYSANAVIEGVANSATLLVADRNELKGEALFVRAFIHFYLTNMFGSIPYITTTDYQQNLKVSKVSNPTIFNNCIADLKEAISLLPENYKSSDRTRPNKFAARALLSKVYLYNQQWNEAAVEASLVIDKTSLYPMETNLDKIFLKESTSTIWQFAPSATGSNTLEAQTYIFTVGPPASSALSSNLLDAFSIGDQRKNKWIQSVSSGSTIWYYAAKYKSRSTAVSTEYSIIIRLNEIYLIRAEARVRAGDLANGKQDLNLIRTNAGLANTNANSQPELLDAILKERKVELFTEQGQRFFDLKRFNKLQTTLSTIKPGWDTFGDIFPIPATEVALNPNLLPQNTGY